MSSYFTLLHSRSTNTLSSARPRPSRLTATPAASSRPVYSRDVNCDPWSVLKISGRPRESDSSSASRQNPTSIVFDSRHESTYRLYRSITAVRYMDPRLIGTCVISELQFIGPGQHPVAEQVRIRPRGGVGDRGPPAAMEPLQADQR